MRILLALFATAAAMAVAAAPPPAPVAGPPRLMFIKEFPGSTPEYMAIEIDKDGKGVYKEAVKDEYPIPFELDPADWETMRALAAKIDQCKRPLESGLKSPAFIGCWSSQRDST